MVFPPLWISNFSKRKIIIKNKRFAKPPLRSSRDFSGPPFEKAEFLYHNLSVYRGRNHEGHQTSHSLTPPRILCWGSSLWVPRSKHAKTFYFTLVKCICWSVYPLHPRQATPPSSILHTCRLFSNKTLLTRAPGVLIFPGNGCGTPEKHFWNISLPSSMLLQRFIFLPRLKQSRKTKCHKALVPFLSYTKLFQFLGEEGGQDLYWPQAMAQLNKSLHEFILPVTSIFSIKQDDSSCS